MVIPVSVLHFERRPGKGFRMVGGILSYVKNDDAKVTRLDSAHRSLLDTIEKVLHRLRGRSGGIRCVHS